MRLSNIGGLVLAAMLFLNALGGCQSGNASSGISLAPESTPAASIYVGSVDELIGPEGRVSSAFDDAEYRQLRRPDAIPPIYDPEFRSADGSDLPSDELIIGLNINGDARAYPAGLLYHREMVNDTVGGVPVLVTWCPLCYTALVHERRVDGSAAVFGNQGALYKGAMTWYDHATGSVWSQPLGEAIAGPLVGSSLELMPSQLTTWEQWLATNPSSRILTSKVPSAPYKGRRPDADHVAGVVVGKYAVAWPYLSVIDAGSITAEIGGIDVVINVDGATGAVRATTADDAGRELPVIIAYRWAWERFYPHGPVDKGGRIQ